MGICLAGQAGACPAAVGVEGLSCCSLFKVHGSPGAARSSLAQRSRCVCCSTSQLSAQLPPTCLSCLCPVLIMGRLSWESREEERRPQFASSWTPSEVEPGWGACSLGWGGLETLWEAACVLKPHICKPWLESTGARKGFSVPAGPASCRLYGHSWALLLAQLPCSVPPFAP